MNLHDMNEESLFSQVSPATSYEKEIIFPPPPPLISNAIGIILSLVALSLSSFIIWRLFAKLHNNIVVSNEVFISIAITVICTLSVCLMTYRSFRYRPLNPVFYLNADSMTVPKSFNSKKQYTINYNDITDVYIHQRRKDCVLILGTHRQVIAYSGLIAIYLSHFIQLSEFIYSRISALPDGESRLSKIGVNNSMTQNVLARKPVATIVFLALIAGIFVVEYFAGLLKDPFELFRWGGNVRALVLDGEWFRLISCNFLHKDFWHIYFNGISLLSLGSILEKLVGTHLFLLVYMVSAIAGAIASCMYGKAIASVGASTAIFGIIGAFLILHIKFFKSMPVVFRQSKLWWVVIIGLNSLLPLFIPMIDISAHIGGFIAGFVLIFWFYRGHRSFSIISIKPSVKAGVWLLGILFILGLAATVRQGQRDTDKQAWKTRFLKALVADIRTKPLYLNGLAWDYAINPDATSEELELALAASQIAVKAKPEVKTFIDTSATIYYRLHIYDNAVRLEREALEIKRDKIYATQLGRFLLAKYRADGLTLQGDISRENVQLSIAQESQNCQLKVTGAFINGVTVYMLDMNNNRLKGLLELTTGEIKTKSGTSLYDLPKAQNALCASNQLQIVLLDARPNTNSGKTLAWHYWSVDSEVLAFP